MGEGHVVENIRKDLEAGYSTVITFLDKPEAIERIERRLSAEFDSTPEGVVMADLRDYKRILAELALARSASLRPPNQNQEPRRSKGRKRRPKRQTQPPQMPPVILGDPGAFTTPIAAEYLGLAPATLETMRVRGGGPVFLKLGRKVVYRKDDLDGWLAERRRKSTSDPGSED